MKTYRVMLEASLWERTKLPSGGWRSKKISRNVVSFPVKRVTTKMLLDTFHQRQIQG